METLSKHMQLNQTMQNWPPHIAKNQFINRGYSIHDDYNHRFDEIHRIDNETLNIISAIIGFLPCLMLMLNLRTMQKEIHVNCSS
jgi:hypothetical protein